MREANAAAFKPEALTRRDASGQIAKQLREAIVRGQWKPGDRLPTEQELAGVFDVARGTAREALKHLSATGMISSTRGSGGGTYVVVPAAEDVASRLSEAIMLWFRAGDVSVGEVDEARMTLEMQCVALAAERRTDTDLEAMAAPLARAQDPAIDTAEWLATDLEFHTAITRAAGNRILELAMTSVHLVRPLTNTVFVELLDRDLIQAQHRAIFEAIRDQDPARARARLLDHVTHLAEVRAQALADRGVNEVPISSLLSQNGANAGLEES
ncbi:FadR/GntR family transcriptional regulator [Streptomyces sp. NPDC046805]|uniref:FadR/GntR family transcriptional regulator n=1 Tax=Streptomyces sp. NPDC046805 TaxID=3155134 RepID=UPI0033C90101